jgi:thioester reductase-like protein
VNPDHLNPAILVTGATGFIGRQVLRELIARGRPVVAMARPQHGLSARDRVMKAVGLVPDEGPLEIIEADLTCPHSGLKPATLRGLRKTVGTVIHCAGDTSFFPEDMRRFRSGHIDGPLALLTSLRGGRLRHWGYLSTAYVCGKRSGTVLEEEGDVGQDFHNPYERVKLEAEIAMRAAGERLGVDVRVFRPSIVVGAAPETAGGQPSNLFFAFIQMMAALARIPHAADTCLRIEAAPRARFNIVPVDYVAQAMAVLAGHPDGAGKTFHLVVSEAPTQHTMLALIADYFGLHGVSLRHADGMPLDNPSPLERRVARMGSAYREYLTQDVRFDDRAAGALLGRLCLPRPTLFAEDVRKMIALALQGPAPRARTDDEGVERLVHQRMTAWNGTTSSSSVAVPGD